ncbi:MULTISPECIES: YnfU family zinc-binding protein [Erwinia]|uniref:YnfU family zinc-binding protein n=1 Tax=Erwinia plantamica TaxID=3237104 RepID=A0ABW7CR19_9GAMM|nr:MULTISPECIES: YnfU family zinc-binding protein [Erwinia]MDN8540468.1 YnfU family zinc-binding protein [Erwinia sp. BC051422]
MSYFNRIMDQITEITSSSTCPVCQRKSQQSIKKIGKKQTLLCPHCKSIFVNPD